MTVGQLIEELQKYDKDLFIMIPDSYDSSYYGYSDLVQIDYQEDVNFNKTKALVLDSTLG